MEERMQTNINDNENDIIGNWLQQPIGCKLWKSSIRWNFKPHTIKCRVLCVLKWLGHTNWLFSANINQPIEWKFIHRLSSSSKSNQDDDKWQPIAKTTEKCFVLIWFYFARNISLSLPVSQPIIGLAKH